MKKLAKLDDVGGSRNAAQGCAKLHEGSVFKGGAVQAWNQFGKSLRNTPILHVGENT